MNPHLPPGCTSAEIEKRFGDPRTREDAGLCEDCGKPLDDFGVCRGECYVYYLERRVFRLYRENVKLRGIIARNTEQRLAGTEATQMFVTVDDVRDSLEICYAEREILSHGSTPERVSSPPCNSRDGLTGGEVISEKP